MALKTLALLFLAGCVTRPVLQPWPCEPIVEGSPVDLELREMKNTTEVLFWEGSRAYFRLESEGLYQATREYVADADAKCVADRALLGQVTEDPLPLPWWQRFWHWVTGHA